MAINPSLAKIADRLTVTLHPLPSIVAKKALPNLDINAHNDRFATSRIYRRLVNIVELLSVIDSTHYDINVYKTLRNRLVSFFTVNDIALPHHELLDLINILAQHFEIAITLGLVTHSDETKWEGHYRKYEEWTWHTMQVCDFSVDCMGPDIMLNEKTPKTE